MSNKTRKKQIENQTQQGRSMVEMLGVLAIIGVISIGGITGYRMAMNRYQANQIANEINLMRTDAKMKVAQGAEKLMLGEPYDSGHLNFGTNYGVEFDFANIESEDEGVTEAGYYIKISGISAGVCKPLVTLLNGMNETVALKINEVEYSADSSTDFCTEESNNALEVDFSTDKIISNSGEEPEPPEEQGDEPICNDETCPGECQEDGTCQCPEENEHWTGTDCITCPTGTTWNDTERDCMCTGANEHWDGNRCVDCGGNEWDEENKECKCDENQYWSDSAGACIENPCNEGQGCEDGYFCKSTGCNTTCTCPGGGSSCSVAEMTLEKSGCTYNKCESIGNPLSKKINGTTYYYYKDTYMAWWNADRYCKALKAQGKVTNGTLVSLEELGCTKTPGTGGCSGDGKLQKALKANGWTGWVWTRTPYNSESENSCNVYTVGLDNDYVSGGNRGSSGYALCE